jgi:isopentenyl-diphosphate delta-isomerase
VLVDEHDRDVGRASLVDAHRGSGTLHRAFTAVLLDERGHVLLARRAAGKPLWPGWWDATVASHPRAGEGYVEAGERRLDEELGLAVPLHDLGRFRYQARWSATGSEHELCAALFGIVPSAETLRADPAEISEVRAISIAALLDGEEPELCPWAWLAFEIARRSLGKAPPDLAAHLAQLERESAPTLLEQHIANSGCSWSPT